MNEWYLRDCSRKIKAVLQAKGRDGKPITNNPPYGYIKDPEDKNHWLIDEEAAAVVRRIFRMAVEGIGPYQIARILTEEKVENLHIIRQSGDMDVTRTGVICQSHMNGQE